MSTNPSNPSKGSSPSSSSPDSASESDGWITMTETNIDEHGNIRCYSAAHDTRNTYAPTSTSASSVTALDATPTQKAGLSAPRGMQHQCKAALFRIPAIPQPNDLGSDDGAESNYTCCSTNTSQSSGDHIPADLEAQLEFNATPRLLPAFTTAELSNLFPKLGTEVIERCIQRRTYQTTDGPGVIPEADLEESSSEEDGEEENEERGITDNTQQEQNQQDFIDDVDEGKSTKME